MNEVAPRLQAFWLRRNRLLARIEELGTQIDAWFMDPANAAPTMHALAELEGLLASRKTMLNDLVVLDDEMLTTLVKVRGAQS